MRTSSLQLPPVMRREVLLDYRSVSRHVNVGPGPTACSLALAVTTAIEAARGLEWWKYVGRDGLVIGIDRFGESAPEKALTELFGFTPAKVAEKIEGWLAARK